MHHLFGELVPIDAWLRLEVYAVMHDLRQSIQFPERRGEPEWRPVQRLRAVVDGRSYLRDLVL